MGSFPVLRLARLLDDPSAVVEANQYQDRIVLKTGGRVTFLDVKDIDWIEAAGVYVYFHVGQKSHLYRATIGQLQERLDPKTFLRIHHSTIVNVAANTKPAALAAANIKEVR